MTHHVVMAGRPRDCLGRWIFPAAGLSVTIIDIISLYVKGREGKLSLVKLGVDVM